MGTEPEKVLAEVPSTCVHPFDIHTVEGCPECDCTFIPVQLRAPAVTEPEKVLAEVLRGAFRERGWVIVMDEREGQPLDPFVSLAAISAALRDTAPTLEVGRLAEALADLPGMYVYLRDDDPDQPSGHRPMAEDILSALSRKEPSRDT